MCVCVLSEANLVCMCTAVLGQLILVMCRSVGLRCCQAECVSNSEKQLVCVCVGFSICVLASLTSQNVCDSVSHVYII